MTYPYRSSTLRHGVRRRRARRNPFPTAQSGRDVSFHNPVSRDSLPFRNGSGILSPDRKMRQHSTHGPPRVNVNLSGHYACRAITVTTVLRINDVSALLIEDASHSRPDRGVASRSSPRGTPTQSSRSVGPRQGHDDRRECAAATRREDTATPAPMAEAATESMQAAPALGTRRTSWRRNARKASAWTSGTSLTLRSVAHSAEPAPPAPRPATG